MITCPKYLDTDTEMIAQQKKPNTPGKVMKYSAR